VNPNKQALERWAEENGVTGDFNSLCENPRAKEYIIGELAKIAKEKKVTALLSLRTWSMNRFLTYDD
jgi:long-chain acyl-CoA synthetase